VEWLIRSGHAVDLVLLVMLAEAVWLHVRRAVPLLALSLALLPGALILLAARAALTGAPWPLIALPLALSFPVHLWDLKRRGWW
jgi:hypothetical protein